MDLGQNLSRSIDYSKRLLDDLGRLLILVILDVIPIVNLVVVGYMTRVIKESPTSNELPPLNEYGSLWVQGLKVTVAAIIYLIIPLIFIAPFVAVTVLAGLISPPVPDGWVLAIPMLLVGVILTFFILIIMSIAIVNMIKKDSFTKAFAFGEILDVIGRIGWGTYLFWTIIIFICALIVGGIGSIPAIGWLLSLIIAPLFGVFVSRSASLVYAEGTAPLAPLMTKGAPAPPAPAPPTEGRVFCVYCGVQLAKDALFCQNCGRKQA